MENTSTPKKIQDMPDFEGSDLQKRLNEKKSQRENLENSLEKRSQETISEITTELENIKGAATRATPEQKKDIDESIASAKNQIQEIENRMRRADTNKDEIAWNALDEKRQKLQQEVSDLESSTHKKKSITHTETNNHGGKEVYFDGAKKEDFDIPHEVLKETILDNQPYSSKSNTELLNDYTRNKEMLGAAGNEASEDHKKIVTDMEDALVKRGLISGPSNKKESNTLEDAVDKAFSGLSDKTDDAKKIERASIKDVKESFEILQRDMDHKKKNNIYISAGSQEKYDAAKQNYHDAVNGAGLDIGLEEKLAKFEKEKTRSWFNRTSEKFKENNPKLNGVWKKYIQLKKDYPVGTRAASFIAFGAIGALATGAAAAGVAGIATYGAIKIGRMAGGAIAANIGKYAGGKTHELLYSRKYKNQHTELEQIEKILGNKTNLNPDILGEYKKRFENAHGKVEENKNYKKNVFKVAGALTGTGLFIGGNMAGAFDGLMDSDPANAEDLNPHSDDIENSADNNAEKSSPDPGTNEMTPEQQKIHDLEMYIVDYRPEPASMIQPGEGVYDAILRQTGSVKETMELLIKHEYVKFDAAGNLVEQVGVRDGMGASYDLVTLPDGTQTIIEGVNGQAVYSSCDGFYDACENIVEMKNLDGTGDLISGKLERQEYLMNNRPKAPIHIPDAIIEEYKGVPIPNPVIEPTPIIQTTPEPIIQQVIIEKEVIKEVPVERVVEKHFYHNETPVVAEVIEKVKEKGRFWKTMGKVLTVGGGIVAADALENGKIDLFGIFGRGGGGGSNIELPNEHIPRPTPTPAPQGPGHNPSGSPSNPDSTPSNPPAGPGHNNGS